MRDLGQLFLDPLGRSAQLFPVGRLGRTVLGLPGRPGGLRRLVGARPGGRRPVDGRHLRRSLVSQLRGVEIEKFDYKANEAPLDPLPPEVTEVSGGQSWTRDRVYSGKSPRKLAPEEKEYFSQESCLVSNR